MPRLALRFISGKYKGGEYILSDSTETVVGRSSNIDLVLMEDMVSRKHARIWVESGQVNLEDFGSTNGTFVNGEKISHSVVKSGDRILIGTSIMKLVETDKDPRRTSSAMMSDAELRTVNMPEQDLASSSPTNISAMSGTIDEVPLPDLIQLLSSSKKTGTLIINAKSTVGNIHLQKGKIVFSSVDALPALPPLRAMFRILSWVSGTFELRGLATEDFAETIDMPTEHILMEGLRRLDEIGNLEGKLPPVEKELAIVTPLLAKLTDLTAEQLEIFQIVLSYRSIPDVIDLSPVDISETVTIIRDLIEKKYICKS